MQCLLFPGQGSQHRGMGSGLFERYPELTDVADEVLGYSLRELCLHDPEDRLRDTRYAQPAIYVVNALAARRALDGAPDRYQFFAGHSLGEYNALVAAGVLTFRTGLELVSERGRLMSRISGGMAAVSGLTAQQVEAVLRASGLPQVYVANRNSDRQTVIAGDRNQLTPAATALRRAGARQVVPLRVSGPFHTPLMAPAVKPFQAIAERYKFMPGHARVVSCISGTTFDTGQAAGLLSRQIARPVEWVRTVRTLRAAGVTRFDEVNGETLTRLLTDIH